MHKHLHSDHISLSASECVLGFESQSWPTIRSPVGFFNTVDLGDLSRAERKPEHLDVVSQASHVMTMCSRSWTYGCKSFGFNPWAVRTPVQYNLCFSMGLPRTGRRPVQLWQPPGWTHLLALPAIGRSARSGSTPLHFSHLLVSTSLPLNTNPSSHCWPPPGTPFLLPV